MVDLQPVRLAVAFVNDRKFSAGTLFFSHTNQPAVLLHEPATIRTSQPNRLLIVHLRAKAKMAGPVHYLSKNGKY